MTSKYGPKPTGALPIEISLTEALFPWTGSGPVFIMTPGSDSLYLPLFDSADRLRAVLSRAGVAFEKIKQVQNGAEFLESIPLESEGRSIVLIKNPWFTLQGKVRFHQVFREGGE